MPEPILVGAAALSGVVLYPRGGGYPLDRKALRAGMALLLLGGLLAGCNLAPAAPAAATVAVPAITPTAAAPRAAPTGPAGGGTPALIAPLPAPTMPAATAIPVPATPSAAMTLSPASSEPSATRPPQPSPTGALPLTPTPGNRPLSVLTTTDIPLPGGTSRFDYQSLDPQRGLLFIAHLGASQVLAFDTLSNRLVATIPAIAAVHGVLAVPALGRVYASATGDNQVAVIDEQTLKVVARIPGGEYPDGLAYDPVSQQVFVSDETGATDTVLATATNRRVATIPLGGEAGNTQYDPGSGRMFVAVQTRNQLAALDPATNQVVARIDLPGCDHGHGLLIDAPARRAFVACDGNATLLTVALDSMQVLDTQSVGDDPDVLALDPDWHRLYIAAESGVLSVFDEQGGHLHKLSEGVFAPAAHSVAVDPRTHRIYLPLANVGGQPVLRIVEYTAP